jgi:hypothetical protein
MKVRITTVDHDGYYGREFPPDICDIGKMVTVIAARQLDVNDAPLVTDDGVDGPRWAGEDASGSELLARARDGFTVFYAVADDGQKFELVEFEVEVLP